MSYHIQVDQSDFFLLLLKLASATGPTSVLDHDLPQSWNKGNMST